MRSRLDALDASDPRFVELEGRRVHTYRSHYAVSDWVYKDCRFQLEIPLLGCRMGSSSSIYKKSASVEVVPGARQLRVLCQVVVPRGIYESDVTIDIPPVVRPKDWQSLHGVRPFETEYHHENAFSASETGLDVTFQHIERRTWWAAVVNLCRAGAYQDPMAWQAQWRELGRICREGNTELRASRAEELRACLPLPDNLLAAVVEHEFSRYPLDFQRACEYVLYYVLTPAMAQCRARVLAEGQWTPEIFQKLLNRGLVRSLPSGSTDVEIRSKWLASPGYLPLDVVRCANITDPSTYRCESWAYGYSPLIF